MSLKARLAARLRDLAARLDPQTTQPAPDRPEVYIDTPGPSVTIKAAGDLDTIAAKALAVFHEVSSTDRAKSPGPGTGFSAERSEQR